MSESGYKCPKCGNEDRFKASVVEVRYFGVDVSNYGWDWSGCYFESDMADESELTCCECQHTGKESEFADMGEEA